jgi:hypothetical protein
MPSEVSLRRPQRAGSSPSAAALICTSTYPVKSLAGIEGVLSPLGDNIDFCVFRENAEGEHRKPSVT